jgi:hypothetical protein
MLCAPTYWRCDTTVFVLHNANDVGAHCMRPRD